MPRLPTIRVIGSQFISTRFPFSLGTSFVGAVMVLIRSLLYLLSRFLSTTAGDIQWSVAIPNDATLAPCWRYSGSWYEGHEWRGHKRRPLRWRRGRPAAHP